MTLADLSRWELLALREQYRRCGCVSCRARIRAVEQALETPSRNTRNRMHDISVGGREGVGLRAYPDGVYLSGWYDSFVGIEGGFVTWEQLDELRRKAKRRLPFGVTR